LRMLAIPTCCTHGCASGCDLRLSSRRRISGTPQCGVASPRRDRCCSSLVMRDCGIRMKHDSSPPPGGGLRLFAVWRPQRRRRGPSAVTDLLDRALRHRSWEFTVPAQPVRSSAICARGRRPGQTASLLQTGHAQRLPRQMAVAASRWSPIGEPWPIRSACSLRISVSTSPKVSRSASAICACAEVAAPSASASPTHRSPPKRQPLPDASEVARPIPGSIRGVPSSSSEAAAFPPLVGPHGDGHYLR
jgi:hypothetical protein